MLVATQTEYAAAVVEATAQALEEDERVFLYAEGINDPGAYLGSVAGLAERFGTARCFDVPNSEDALVGLGVGAALMGLRPVFISLRVDFLMLAMNQIVNHAARWPAMTGYQTAVPLTIRALVGRGWGQAAQHAGALYSMFANVPGLEVVLPSSADDAGGLLLSAVRSDLTTIVVEERGVYATSGQVPSPAVPIPLGQGRVLREGSDITFVGVSSATHLALAVADLVAPRISAEVVDLRTVRPLDSGLIRACVARTGRLAVFDIGWSPFGLAAEVSRVVLEAVPSDPAAEAEAPAPLTPVLKAPILNISRRDEHTPSSCFLEDAHYPKAAEAAARVEALVG